MKLRNLLLKSIPYLASITGGTLLFCLSVNATENPTIIDLLIDVSASLFSLPLVFVLYEYTNSLVARRLRKTLASTMRDKVSVLMLHLLLILRKMLRLRGRVTLTWINSLSTMSESDIMARLYMRSYYSNLLTQYHSELENIIYRYGKENILDTEQLRLLSFIGHNISRFLNEHHLHGNRQIRAKCIKNLLEEIIDWLNSGAATAMDFEQLLAASHKKNAKISKKK